MRRAIQILIIVLILLSCGGMFSVCVVRVHEAADRAQCFNNCRIIGMSLQYYHDTYAEFPSAALPNPALTSEKQLSWIVSSVPFVQASNLYERMNKEKSWDAEENRFVIEYPMFYLQCPGYSRRSPDAVREATKYVGISGIGDNAIALPREDPHAGFFGYDRPVKVEELKRGASETLMVVETSQVHGIWTAAGSPTTRGLIPDGAPYIGVGGQFGGNHRQGANVTFADGSVRFIEQSIDPAVWEAMATLSGKSNRE